jgi:hypothetical protein
VDSSDSMRVRRRPPISAPAATPLLSYRGRFSWSRGRIGRGRRAVRAYSDGSPWKFPQQNAVKPARYALHPRRT